MIKADKNKEIGDTNMDRPEVKLFDKDGIEKSYCDMGSVNMKIARVVDDPASSPLGGGFIELKNEGFEWKVLYDEIICVIEGELTIRHKNHNYKAKSGEVLFLQKGVDIEYGAEEYAKFFYAIYPVNWREIEGIK